jgi:hypothetical protein
MGLEAVGEQFVAEARAAGAFGVIVGDRVVQLLDLDPEPVARIAALAAVPWVELLTAPTANLGAAMALIEAAEATADAPATRPYSVVDVMVRFVRVRPEAGD